MLLRRATRFAPFMARRVVRIYPAFLAVVLPIAAANWLLATGRLPSMGYRCSSRARVALA
jgi:peptidoglycan/LPS O-acetylase OafA/YrhL